MKPNIFINIPLITKTFKQALMCYHPDVGKYTLFLNQDSTILIVWTIQLPQFPHFQGTFKTSKQWGRTELVFFLKCMCS